MQLWLWLSLRLRLVGDVASLHEQQIKWAARPEQRGYSRMSPSPAACRLLPMRCTQLPFPCTSGIDGYKFLAEVGHLKSPVCSTSR